jgi:hypothetical protein
VSHFAAVCDGLRQSATVCDGLRQSATVCDGLRQSATVCDGLRRFATAGVAFCDGKCRIGEVGEGNVSKV